MHKEGVAMAPAVAGGTVTTGCSLAHFLGLMPFGPDKGDAANNDLFFLGKRLGGSRGEGRL